MAWPLCGDSHEYEITLNEYMPSILISTKLTQKNKNIFEN